jgi:hypothetical protein
MDETLGKENSTPRKSGAVNKSMLLLSQYYSLGTREREKNRKQRPCGSAALRRHLHITPLVHRLLLLVFASRISNAKNDREEEQSCSLREEEEEACPAGRVNRVASTLRVITCWCSSP